MNQIQKRLSKPKINYSYGPYNKYNEKEQWIRITEGCPHNCPFCYEPQENKIFEIPRIVRNNVKIMDMNLLCKPESIEIIKKLGKERPNGKTVQYDIICGIDYRFLTQEISDALKKLRLQKIRIAWDWFYKDQIKIRKTIQILSKSGFNKEKQDLIKKRL